MSDEQCPATEDQARAEAVAVVDAAKQEVDQVDQEQLKNMGARLLLAELSSIVLAQDSTLGKTVAALLGARQLYIVAYRDLALRIAAYPPKRRHDLFAAALKEFEQRMDSRDDARSARLKQLVTEEGPEIDTMFDLLGQMFIQSTALRASEAFTEADLLTGLSQTIVPWLKGVVPYHAQEEANYRARVADEAEKRRRATDVPLAFAYDPELGKQLKRDRPLILVGWDPLLRYLLDQTMEVALAANAPQLYTVARLSTRPQPRDPHSRMVRLGGNLWEGCAHSRKSWAELFAKHMLRGLSSPVDLLIVDDLPHSVKGVGLLGGDAVLKASYAQKNFRYWAKDMGAAFIGGVPLPENTTPKTGTPGWEELRNFCTLRPIHVVEETDDYYKVVIGSDADFLEISKADLAPYLTSKLVLP